MAEPINLPPLHVHAVSVPVRRPPNSIAGPDEMMLQLGENGGVQVDLFGRDAQGNELHESREMQEDEYEEMRKDYLRAELATMPPFSSFKSGNTIGRVVGETAPAQVPASRANPPIEAETEEEGITGEQVLDGIQLGLDVVGLIPVFGEIADLANAGVSAARGDYVGAGLSLLSAIPFVGYAGTAGKAARYGTTMVEASGKAAKEATDKAAKEAADKAAKEAAEKKAKEAATRKRDQENEDGQSGGKIKSRKQLDVECFKLPDGADEDEFLRQLKEQEDELNSIDANSLISRRQAIKAAGGTDALRDSKAQRKARKDYKRKRLSDLLAQDVHAGKAKEIVSEELQNLAATHALDIIAGGDPSKVTMGDKNINSSVGAQWRGRRSQSLEDHAKEMVKDGTGKDKLKVKLKKCPG